MEEITETSGLDPRKRVILSWEILPSLIRERPVAVAWVNELNR